jgi:hypothetical protein
MERVMSDNMKLGDGTGNWIDGLFEHCPPMRFAPIAYYDKHLDCIRVEIRDCSVTEHRCGEHLTVLEDNYPKEGQMKYVGFAIKGVRHVFETLEVPLEGIQLVVDFLDKIVRMYPSELVSEALVGIMPILRETELRVDFADAA